MGEALVPVLKQRNHKLSRNEMKISDSDFVSVHKNLANIQKNQTGLNYGEAV